MYFITRARCAFLLLALAIVATSATGANAGIISSGSLFTPSPVGAWGYYESATGQPPGSNSSYYPTSLAEFASAQFKGYIVPDPTLSATYGGDVWYGDGLQTYQIFKTYVQSAITQTIPITLAGDDGHSLFVDGIFRSGAGFGGTASFSLTLQAGVPREVLLAGYNAQGNWIFLIGDPISLPLPTSGRQFTSAIGTTPGVELSADRNFAVTTVPEPASLIVFCIGGVSLTFTAARRRP